MNKNLQEQHHSADQEHRFSRGVTRRHFSMALAGIGLTSMILGRASAITFGELDGNAHPAAGAVVLTDYLVGTNPNLDSPRPVASGSLIHPRLFLTAGHITAELEDLMALNGGEAATLDKLRISFGSDSNDPATWREIEALITHPGFTPRADSSGASPTIDVGVIVLKDAVTDITPVALPPLGLLDDLLDAGMLRDGNQCAPFLNVGYGTQLALTPSPTLVIPDGLRRHSVSRFQTLLKHYLRMSQNPHRDNAGTGYGDSGGPAIWVDPDTGTETVVAITSRGDTTTISTGLSFRLDIPITMDFLDSVIAVVD